MSNIDLHVHSSASDGTLPPSEVVFLALKSGLSAMALTDHDTVDGVPEALRAAADTPLELIPGAELSCNYAGKEIHVLGLYLNPTDPVLLDTLVKLREARMRRNADILRLFQQDGFSITQDDLTSCNPNTVITRAHFARALLDKGYVTSVEQAFSRYLGDGKKYYLPKENFDPEQAVRLILSSGGFPVLAHPIQYRLGWKKTENLISELREMGLQGVEVYYSSHLLAESQQLNAICKRCGLLPTGGSDFHGSNKPDIKLGVGYGGLRVPEQLLSDIKRAMDGR